MHVLYVYIMMSAYHIYVYSHEYVYLLADIDTHTS
jgi:hypothetical protein